MEADKHGKLVLYAFTDVGPLNNVIELWRYPSMQGSLRARQASRCGYPFSALLALDAFTQCTSLGISIVISQWY